MDNNQNEFNSWDNEVYVDNKSYQNYNSVSEVDIESKLITRTFIFMFMALLVTTATAVIVAMDFEKMSLVYEHFVAFAIAEIVVVLANMATVRRKMAAASGVLFAIYSVINGITLSFIFYAYELGSIQNIFLITALLFGIMAIVGATTKVRLSSIGGMGTMLLIGVILTTLINALFIHSTGLDMVMNYIVVFIFVGLTAYDTQRIKNTAMMISEEDINVESVYFGMELYLDFINIFLRLLAIFGKRK